MRAQKRLALAVSLACAALGSTAALAATNAEIQAAIDNSLKYFNTNKLTDGSGNYYWAYGGYEPAVTGAATFAILSQQSHWADSGAGGFDYQAIVDKSMAYLLSTATKQDVSTRNDGVNICPGGSGSCAGVFWNAASNEDSYTTGLIAPAIGLYAAGHAGDVATATGPLAGMTWGQIAQGITNLWASSQSTANQGALIGGWRYVLGAPIYDSDMSTTQWGIISMIYDQTLGATTPGIVTTDLAKWLAFAQNNNNLSLSYGAGCYQGPNSGICDFSDTGGMLVGLNFIGKSASDPAVQKALDFLNTYWDTFAGGTWDGNFDHPYAMWAVYKGLETTLGLTDPSFPSFSNLLNNTCSGGTHSLGAPTSGICNWWQDYNQWLVDNQNADGSWSGYSYWTGNLATAFDLSILSGTAIPQPPQPTPEPATLALLAIGLTALGATVRRRKS